MKKRIEDFGSLMQAAYLKNGLTNEEVKLRRTIDGPNVLPEKKKTSEWIKYLHELSNIFSLLLWGASILALIGYGLAPSDLSNLWLAIVIIIVILVSATFSYVQNNNSGKIMESFKTLGVSQVKVIRQGEITKIPAQDLVKGDVVSLTLGEKIPADIRIFQSNDLQVDNSALTGELHPVAISANCGDKGRENPLEATNLVFFSTLV